MIRYFLDQFLEDCKALGWYESKVGPAWKDCMDLPIKESDLEKVLMYKEDESAIPIIMDYNESASKQGISFHLEYMGHGQGHGTVTNKSDLEIYMKVCGYNQGFVPKKR